MAGKFSRLWHDPIHDAVHKAVSATNRDTKRFVGAQIPVDDGEVRDGLRCLKEKGRPADDVIKSLLYVKGEQRLARGRSRKDSPSNQLVANVLAGGAQYKSGKVLPPQMSLTESQVHRFWERTLDIMWERETNKIRNGGR